MFDGARHFEEHIHSVVRRSGFPEIRLAHLTLIRNMDPAGLRLTVLAERAGMTKQAMGELVDQCAEMGLVARIPDPTDGRARRIVFTARGRKLLETTMTGIAEAESAMSAVIGPRAMRDVAAALRAYRAEIEKEQAA